MVFILCCREGSHQLSQTSVSGGGGQSLDAFARQSSQDVGHLSISEELEDGDEIVGCQPLDGVQHLLRGQPLGQGDKGLGQEGFQQTGQLVLVERWEDDTRDDADLQVTDELIALMR